MGTWLEVLLGSLAHLDRRGRGVSASGIALPERTLRPRDVTSWRVEWRSRQNVSQVSAYYRDTESGETMLVSQGRGDNQAVLPGTYSTQGQAEAAALTALHHRQRLTQTLAIRMPGDATLAVETPITLQAWRSGIAQNWIITRTRHRIKGSGFTTEIDAELPTDAPGERLVSSCSPQRSSWS